MDWKEIARRYPMPDGAHPERPWWRIDECGVHVRTDGFRRGDAGDIAATDHEHPLPAPLPACGQVWGGRGEELVTAVLPLVGEKAVVNIGGRSVWFPKEWPPGPALVAGPGAPWQNTQE